MSHFKWIFLFIMFGITLETKAQSFTRQSLGVSKIAWNERIQAINGGLIDYGKASYSGFAISYEHAWFQGRMGYGLGAFYGSGEASAGDFDGTVLPMGSGRRTFSAIGILPRYFYRHTAQIQSGVMIPLLYRKAAWDKVGVPATFEEKRDLALLGALQLRVLLTPEWEVVQDLGAFSFESETFWRMSLFYRL